MRALQFTWREDKHAANIKNHKVSFLRAALIFENEIVEMIDDREDYGELRYVALGHVQTAVYRVVYTRPDDRTVHIISAWKANKHDQKTYYHKIYADRD
jgi:uncharacterized DUF497 family protein